MGSSEPGEFFLSSLPYWPGPGCPKSRKGILCPNCQPQGKSKGTFDYKRIRLLFLLSVLHTQYLFILFTFARTPTICLLCSMIRNTRLVFSHNELSKLTMMNHQMDYRTLRRAIFTKNLYNFSAFTTYLQDSARKISNVLYFFYSKMIMLIVVVFLFSRKFILKLLTHLCCSQYTMYILYRWVAVLELPGF